MRFQSAGFILAVSLLALGWGLPVRGDAPVMALPWNTPVLDCIKTAQRVYVFPNTDTRHPTRDDKHMRLLDPEARAALVGLLDDKDDWWQGLYTLVFPNSPHADLGFVFKGKGCELVLFFTGEQEAKAILGDVSTGGLLNEDASRKLKEWGARYAQLELSVPSVPPPVVTRQAPSNITVVNSIAVTGDYLSQLSASDIHQVFAAFEGAGLSHPYAVSVSSKDEIRGYLQADEWMTARRVTCATSGSGQPPCWEVRQDRLPEYADAMRCIRGANYVHIFPTAAPLEHRRNFSYPDTMLGDPARNELTELLGAKESWSEASDSSMPPPGKLPTDMGFELIDIDQAGRCQADLFFSPDGKVQGDLDDEYLSGTLSRTAAQVLQAWYAKYAQAELDASRETPAPSPSSKFAGDVVDGATVVFVCEHGNAKSLIAAALFNQEAARRHLPFRAVARGVKPGQGVPASIAASLRHDGYDVSGFTPKPIAAADVQAALRVVLLNLDRDAIPGSDPHKTDTWSGIPPAETEYPKSHDAIAAQIDSLLQQLERRQ